MKIQTLLTALAAMPLVAGCASVIDGETQPITVMTTPEAGATCTASNGRGQWTLVTPATVVIEKSGSVLSIHCSKAGWKDGTAYASGRISNAGLVGMMLPYVGLLNAAIDGSTGAAQHYPDSYTIQMKPAVPAAAPTSGVTAPASATTAQSAAPTGQTH